MISSIRGENVYECDTCRRKERVPQNSKGMDVLPNCNITLGCLGKLRRVLNAREIINTPVFPPEVEGLTDWYARRILYTHEQQIAYPVWTITHNLANKPVIHAYTYIYVDDEAVLQSTEPELIETIDLNTTRLTFKTAVSGLAQCISLTSQNTTNPNATAPIITPASVMQLSSDSGEVTIATLDNSPAINVSASYLTSSAIVQIDYTRIDNTPSIESPWVNVSGAIINGRRYTVRSFNLQTTASAPTYFNQGLVPNDTGFYLTSVNGQPLTPGSVLFLLGTSPYATVDRVLDRVIDPYYVNQTSPQLSVSSGRSYAQPDIIRTTYPPILVLS